MGLSRPWSYSGVELLLRELCVGLGFCLPPEAQRRLCAEPPVEVDAFTDAVFVAEGMGDMRYTRLWEQVREVVERHMAGRGADTGGVIAVTGASGQVGGRVARLLTVPYRIVTRSAIETDKEQRFAEYRDKSAMTRALQGADTVFLVSGREAEDRLEEHKTAVDAAKEAGVERVVYLSFFGAAPDCTFTFGRDHWHTEQYIRDSGLRFTFLRDNIYLEMIPRLAGADGVIRGPAGDGRLAAVSYDDIAAAAVAVLEDGGGHDGVTYNLTGPEAFTLHEAAQVLGLRYEPETVEEAYASRAHYGAAEFEVRGWVTTYEAIAAGELDGVTDDVLRLTGRVPRSLAQIER